MKDRGITISMLIKEYNVSTNTLHRFKTNKSVTARTINRMCEILDCRVEDRR